MPVSRLLILTCFMFACAAASAAPPMAFPGEHWLAYDDPAAAGWSVERLADARRLADEAGIASYMIVENGYVVAAWGDPARRYKCHSLRKSFLSALYGIRAGRGEVDPDMTLAELGIDDVHELLPVEKSATVLQLLQARSGVYHPAAYETESMKARRPARGSHPPGSFYYYNNWDFNTLAGIFRDRTGVDVHSAFRGDLAMPLGMQDFRPADTYYHLEADASRYPAYPLRLSTRDAARFGLLYLADGEWDGRRIVPADWVRRSSVPYSTAVRSARGYGLLWWVSEDPVLGELGMYHASGVGGQVIAVVPGKQLVIVQRVDTYRGDDVSYRDTLAVMKAVIAARVGESRQAVATSPLRAGSAASGPPSAAEARALAGRYATENGGLAADVTVAGDAVRVAWHGSETHRDGGGVHRFHEGQHYRIVRGAGGDLEVEDTGYRLSFRASTGGAATVLDIARPNVPLTLHRIRANGD